jgi:hypothetical protein
MIAAALFLGITSVHAQTKQTPATSVSGYGGGVAELTFIDGKPALNIGGYGGFLLNRRLLIGVSGNNIMFKHTVNGAKENMSFNYYGLYTEYRFPTQSILQVSAGVTGAMGWLENKLVSSDKNKFRRDGDMTFVIQPKLGLNVRVTKFMQIQGYASYRFTGNTNSTHYTQNNFNGVSGGAGLLFGGF